ncbi:type VII secretion system-associated protein [Spirilliplanes yamanashiensis]|uniref:SseB protein N-terminal domain-containing protein n=1 Tax=Spirilliplanes yamanashiensis TaxID=42233 RepID=A0A8J3Y884_9ACTN|nr:type VII secretion system-associated protein [Spirilliplanes yamanashiensis]MDP9817280.1 hypothetical protein [Spirilliplanes yamanashiensis]GIJ03068.1 hypothetical protein Sya03_24200 [Spirilliplanes yamanashiensis]
MTTGVPAHHLLLTDPRWRPGDDGEEPPPGAVVGLWPVHPDGSTGPFSANPGHRPGTPDAPTDPLDAALRLLARRRLPPARVRLLLRESLVDVALDASGAPLLTASPDAATCVMVATAGAHAERIGAPRLLRAGVAEVAALLDDDVDVLVNPGGPAPVRLTRDFWCATAALTPADAAAGRAPRRSGTTAAPEGTGPPQPPR